MTIRTRALGLLIALVSLYACSDDSTAPPPEEFAVVNVYFDINVDGAPIQLGNSLAYTNPSGTKYGIETVRFIISDLTLHGDQGESVLLKGVHYFDISDPATQVIHVENAPHANYTSVSFTFGLNETRNRRNAYPSIPAVMVWPAGMGAELGYHYMQLDGDFEFSPDGPTGSYTTHTGAHHLPADTEAHHYHFPVSASFTPAHIHEGEAGELDLTFNLNGWYLDHTPADGIDTQYDFKTLGDQGIMDDADAQQKLRTNGPGCFSATMTTGGGHDH